MAATTEPAPWNDDLLRDPHHVADKGSRVQRMFAAIAPKYDLNNRVHSFGMDQRWRKKAVKLSGLSLDDSVVDVACGTGDLSMLYDRALATLRASELNERRFERARSRVTAIDFTYDMLPHLWRKVDTDLDESVRLLEENLRTRAKKGDRRSQRAVRRWQKPDLARGLPNHPDCPTRMSVVNADATALPLANASADVISIAFGIRNVQEPAKAIAEFFRVLKPGGRVIVLEFSRPRNRLIRFFNDLYCNRIMPTTATWLSGDKSGAYKYLPMSVATFMNREQMMTMLRDAGFVDVTQHPMTFGVAVVYRGYKR